MLKALSIRNVVLIDKLDLEFDSGLCVLTGETGSGKSILLDALGLAIGVRADTDLIKLGKKQSAVVAEFVLDIPSALMNLLDGQGIESGKSLILRRVLNHDGRSRAFINDQPVSVTFLREVGNMLVEVNGQMEAQGLLDSNNHGAFVDAFGGLNKENRNVAKSYVSWKEAEKKLKEENLEYNVAIREEEFLRHSINEFDELDIRPGEEELLSRQRTMLIHSEKIAEALNESIIEINNGRGVDGSLRFALQTLERVSENANGLLDEGIGALERAIIEAGEANSELQNIVDRLNIEPAELEKVEERLFAIRALARKHDTDVAGLSLLRDELNNKLLSLEEGSSRLHKLNLNVTRYRDEYIKYSKILTEGRRDAANAIDRAIKKEFPPLKLDSVKFETKFDVLGEHEWGENGLERLSFEVQTNPNTPKGPIDKVVSGGELARLMLALKVVLANTNAFPTIIFDEVDSGISGAAAAAVGERLAILGQTFQVLVVTHSPQVAAKGSKHFRKFIRILRW